MKPPALPVPSGNLPSAAPEELSGIIKAESDDGADAAQEQTAIPPLCDVLRQEYDEQITGWLRNIALDKRGREIESAVLLDLERKT